MTNIFKVGDTVRIISGSVYENNNQKVPENILKLKLFVRAIKDNKYTVARAKTGPVLGDIAEINLQLVDEDTAKIDAYVVYIPNHDFPLYHSPSKNSGVIRRIKRSLHTIVDEKNGFGKIKSGAGWVELTKVRKM